MRLEQFKNAPIKIPVVPFKVGQILIIPDSCSTSKVSAIVKILEIQKGRFKVEYLFPKFNVKYGQMGNISMKSLASRYRTSLEYFVFDNLTQEEIDYLISEDQILNKI